MCSVLLQVSVIASDRPDVNADLGSQLPLLDVLWPRFAFSPPSDLASGPSLPPHSAQMVTCRQKS